MNETCQDTSFSDVILLTNWQSEALTVLNILAIVFNLSLNVTVIYMLKTSQMLKNTSLRLICYLSVSDCFMACTVQVVLAVLLINKTAHCSLEAAAQFFGTFAGHTSAYTIAVIGYDRFLRIKYLMRYSSLITVHREFIAMFVVVIASFAHACLYTIGSVYDQLSVVKRITLAVDILVAVSLIVTYLMTVAVLRKYRRASSDKLLLKTANKVITRVSAKILLTVCIIYIVYLAMKTTYSALKNKVDDATQSNLAFGVYVSYVLVYCNGWINALIFITSNNKMKEDLKNRTNRLRLKSFSLNSSLDVSHISTKASPVEAS